jgi:GH25 family lysozyme M1 (1,4-beta-N-acetylmuramidase)
VGWFLHRWRLAAFALVPAATLAATVAAATPAVAGPKVPGIDVSKYQGDIRWRAVASTRVRFVVMRSTLGNEYVDPRFRRNLAGATASGLVVGAYHFAKPGPAPWDARVEADHFLRVARNASGDLLPVLDIEDSGGLGRRRLLDWARGWLRRVRERTGLRAMIYSGNHFWRDSMGNTAWFARRGHPFWVAHWYVRGPDVPGHRWGGRGRTIWQWSARGRVHGIRGDVDLDRFRGRSLLHGKIASLSVTRAAGGVVEGPRIACGSGETACRRLANPGDELTLRAVPVPGATLIGWTGACEAAGTSSTCRVSMLGTRQVSAVFGYASSVGADGGTGDRRGSEWWRRDIGP